MEQLTDEAKVEAWDLLSRVMGAGYSVVLCYDWNQWREWVQVDANCPGARGAVGNDHSVMESLRFLAAYCEAEKAKVPPAPDDPA